MAKESIVSKKFKIKQADGSFGGSPVYFGTYANFITMRRPNSDNYENLQTYLEILDQKISSGVVWTNFSE